MEIIKNDTTGATRYSNVKTQQHINAKVMRLSKLFDQLQILQRFLQGGIQFHVFDKNDTRDLSAPPIKYFDSLIGQVQFKLNNY